MTYVCMSIVLVIPKVLAQKQEIAKHEVKVELFYPYLSQAAAVADSRYQQAVMMPQDVVIMLDRLKSKFVRSNDKFCTELESQLAASDCKVQWPAAAADADDAAQLVLHCIVDRDVADAARRVHHWTDHCQAVADQHLARIASTEEKISAEVWDKFVQEIKSAAESALSELYVEQDDASCTLCCVGVDDVVAQFHTTAVAVNTRLMQELATAKSIKFEVISNLSAAQLHIIRTSRFWEAMSTNVEVTFDGHGILLQGSETDIMAVKVKMYELVVNRIQSERSRSETPFKLKLLRKPEVMQYCQNIFEQRKLNVACSVTDGELVMHALDSSHISEARAVFERELAQTKVPLDSFSSAALNLPQWKDVETAMKQKWKLLEIVVAADRTSVMCCGVRDQVADAKAEIKKFLEQNTIVEQFVKLPEGKVKYIFKHLAAEVDRIVKSAQNDGVKLEPIEDGSKSGIVVRGTRSGLQAALLSVDELSEDVLEVVHDSDLPGTQKYFATKRGKDSLMALENRSRVVVIVSREPVMEQGNDTAAERAQTAASKPMVKSQVCVAESKTKILVVKGNVIECQADALIVTLADDLKHSHGAARLVATAGTHALILYCIATLSYKLKSCLTNTYNE